MVTMTNDDDVNDTLYARADSNNDTAGNSYDRTRKVGEGNNDTR